MKLFKAKSRKANGGAPYFTIPRNKSVSDGEEGGGEGTEKPPVLYSGMLSLWLKKDALMREYLNGTFNYIGEYMFIDIYTTLRKSAIANELGVTANQILKGTFVIGGGDYTVYGFSWNNSTFEYETIQLEHEVPYNVKDIQKIATPDGHLDVTVTAQ